MSVYHNMMTDEQKLEGLKASHAILSEKSETPRTDTIYDQVRNMYPLKATHDEWFHRCACMCDHARQLERELNAMSVKYEQSIFERCNLLLQNKSLLDELTQIKTHRRDA